VRRAEQVQQMRAASGECADADARCGIPSLLPRQSEVGSSGLESQRSRRVT